MMKLRSPTILVFRYLLPSGALLCALIAPVQALAGGVYKCDGPNGQLAFTNKPNTFSHCKKVADYIDPPVVPTKVLTAKGPHTDYSSAPAASNTRVESADPTSTAAPSTAAPPTDKKAEVRRGAVYKVAKTDGITEYTNIRPHGGAYQILFTYMSTCYACNVHSTVDWSSTVLRLDAYRNEITMAAAQSGVDPALLRAIIHAESAFNPNAVSIKGAQGLMQLMPGTASDLGVDNPFDATQNIRGGAQYLAALLKQFHGDERLAAAAYDAGAENVQKYKGVPPFGETQVYVERVGTLRQRYHDASPPAPIVAAVPAAAPSS